MQPLDDERHDSHGADRVPSRPLALVMEAAGADIGESGSKVDWCCDFRADRQMNFAVWVLCRVGSVPRGFYAAWVLRRVDNCTRSSTI